MFYRASERPRQGAPAPRRWSPLPSAYDNAARLPRQARKPAKAGLLHIPGGCAGTRARCRLAGALTLPPAHPSPDRSCLTHTRRTCPYFSCTRSRRLRNRLTFPMADVGMAALPGSDRRICATSMGRNGSATAFGKLIRRSRRTRAQGTEGSRIHGRRDPPSTPAFPTGRCRQAPRVSRRRSLPV